MKAGTALPLERADLGGVIVNNGIRSGTQKDGIVMLTSGSGSSGKGIEVWPASDGLEGSRAGAGRGRTFPSLSVHHLAQYIHSIKMFM